jgi:hypothetical protein
MTAMRCVPDARLGGESSTKRVKESSLF